MIEQKKDAPGNPPYWVCTNCKWALTEAIVFDGLEKLNLTVRSERCLKADEVYTLTQLLNCTKDRLLKTPNMGRKSVNEIIEKLAEHGLKLKGEA